MLSVSFHCSRSPFDQSQTTSWVRFANQQPLVVVFPPLQLGGREAQSEGDLAATVGSILRDTGFSPTLLELEVTENILLEINADPLAQ